MMDDVTARKRREPTSWDGLDVVGITYIRCASGELSEFNTVMQKELLKRPEMYQFAGPNGWRKETTGDCRVVPMLFGATVGVYDYVLITLADSARAVSKFVSDFLRSSKLKDNSTAIDIVGFGDLVIDTNTSVIIDYNPKVSMEVRMNGIFQALNAKKYSTEDSDSAEL